jgi:hypothetical protein
MKKNRILYILLALLVAVAAFVLLTDRKSTWNRESTDFAIRDTSSVYRIFLADKAGNQSDLQKRADGTWSLNETFTARQDAVELFLSTVQKIAVMQAVPHSAHNNVVSRLGASATKVEIYQHKALFSIGKRSFFVRPRLSKVYYVGDATMNNRGTYMLMDKSSRPFIVHIPGFRGFLHTRYSPKATDWRSHVIFSYRLSEIKSIEVKFLDATQESFRLDYKGGTDMQLTPTGAGSEAPLIAFDTTAMLDFLVSFTDVRFEDFLDDMTPETRDSIAASRPIQVITITDAMGRVRQISTFARKNEQAVTMIDGAAEQIDLDRLYIYLHDSKELVLGQYFSLDRLLQPLSFYLGN